MLAFLTVMSNIFPLILLVSTDYGTCITLYNFMVTLKMFNCFFAHCPGLSCNFEDNLCGWYQDNSDNFDWTLSDGTDHTTGIGGSKWKTSYAIYIYTYVYNVYESILKLLLLCLPHRKLK